MRTLNPQVSSAKKGGAILLGADRSMPDIAAAPSAPFSAAVAEGRVQEILRMVETGANHSIREFALKFNLSPSYLQRLFKLQTGVSMGEWLSEQKLQRAAHLLANSYMTVKEIAHLIGYEHPSSFIRAFERRYAQAPARYRKQIDGAKC